MTDPLRTALLYSLFPVVATILGAAAGAYLPGLARWRSLILHFAAGVVFSVISVDLLPEVTRRALVPSVVVGFTLGVTVMFAARYFSERLSGEASRANSASKPAENLGGLLAAVAIDFFIDGLLLGIGFAAGSRIGILLALAETAEQFSVGLALTGELTRSGVSPRRATLTALGLSMIVFVAAAGGATVLGHLTDRAMETVLSFGLAALLYLVTEELLKEAHEEPESRVGTALFFVGFLLFLVIGMVVG